MVSRNNSPMRAISGNAPKRMPAGRRCVKCDGLLSIYNLGDICYSCLEDIPLRQRPFTTRKLGMGNTWDG